MGYAMRFLFVRIAHVIVSSKAIKPFVSSYRNCNIENITDACNSETKPSIRRGSHLISGQHFVL